MYILISVQTWKWKREYILDDYH